MEPLTSFFTEHWFTIALLALALGLAVRALLRRRRQAGTFRPAVVAAACALAGLGGLLSALLAALTHLEDPAGWAWWTVAAALAALFALFCTALLTRAWSARLGYAAGAVLLLGLGGVAADPITQAFALAAKTIARLEVAQPWWLLLLLLLPAIVGLGFRSLAGLGPVRRWLAIGLRCSLVVLLTLALAEVRLRFHNENLTVLFLVDRSLSIPEDYGTDPKAPQRPIDRRWERIKRFINHAVEYRGPGRERDKAGVIVFGRQPRLELPPSDVARLNFSEIASTIDGNYTDIGAAIKLALASFPEGTGKRIVLLSDGNENLGNAEEQARIAALNNGVQIDVVPLAAGYRNENEVMVQSVEAPPRTEQNSQVPIRVLVRSFNPHTVVGSLTLNQIAEGQVAAVPPSPVKVKVRRGLNPFFFRQSLARQEQQSFTYEAIFQPEVVVDDQDNLLPQATAGLKQDRVQNNHATTHVIALGRRRVLLIEPKEGEHPFLVEHLRKVGSSRFTVHNIAADALPADEAELAIFLSSYDCVILANVAASDVGAGDVPDRVPGVITQGQQEVLRSNTHDQGCGLIMIGGPNGFGAGGWQGTPVEKALPVDCDIKSLKVTGKGGLVLIMHASEMADGNRWQKEIAKLAIKKLSAVDEVGILYFDWGNTTWHIPLAVIGEGRDALLRQVDSLSPGDMPEFDTGLQMAYNALTDPRRGLANKHIIIISDGDPSQTNNALLGQMLASKVTVTTVGVATHGAPQDQALAGIARATRGRFYNVRSPKALPAIYIKETRLVSQSFVYEKAFEPKLIPFHSGPTANLPAPLRPLHGFVRTTAKDSPFVEMPILGPSSAGQQFPVLAYWHYGLGKAVAFTSDARSMPGRPGWDRDWAGSDMYLKFWEQVVDWSLRAVETGELTMTAEYRDGKVKVVVDARDVKDADGKHGPLTGVVLQGAVTPPSARAEDARQLDLKFEEKSSGLYEAEVKVEATGSYFLRAQAARDGKIYGVRSGVTVPYSPEFAELEGNAPLLERLRAMTGGRTYADDDTALEAAARSGDVFRRSGLPPSRSWQPVWHWLLWLTGLLLLFDVAVRRIALEPAAVVSAMHRAWERLRGRAAAPAETPQFLDRLKSRKAQVAESIDRERAARRLESTEPAAGAPPGADQARPEPPPKPAPSPQPEPAAEKEPEDFASRLLRAKKRIWEEREKDKDK